MQLQTAVAVWILVSGAALAQAPQSGVWMGAGPLQSSAVVQNRPFSADLVMTNDNQSPRSAVFNHEMQGKVARNSQGLTYMSITAPAGATVAGAAAHVTITDPAQHTLISLNPQNKTAFINRKAGPVASAAVATPMPSNIATSPASSTQRASTAAPSAIVAGQTASSTQVSRPEVETKTEKLGTREMGGLQVTGTRTTVTTSWVGNGEKKTTTAVTDSWTSPELQVVVMRDFTDSTGGHHISRLANIVQTEPEAALFQIPTGYTQKEVSPLNTAAGAPR